MKQIIEFDPADTIKSSEVSKSDVIIVFKDDEIVGYVHSNGLHQFTLYTNYIIDDFIEIEREFSFNTLKQLILAYPFLTFKIL
ncbi:MAG: hypothetical protein ACOH2V_00830 [Candidatus Saccharimonadaceae bacterium]